MKHRARIEMVHHARTPKNRHDGRNRSRKKQHGGAITPSYAIECSLSPSKWVYSDISGNAFRDDDGAIVPVPDTEVSKLTKVMHRFPGTTLSVPKKFEGRIINVPTNSSLWTPPIMNPSISQIVYSKESPTRFLLSEDGVNPLSNPKGDLAQAPIFEVKVTPKITLRDSKGTALKMELEESILQQQGPPSVSKGKEYPVPRSRIRAQTQTETEQELMGQTERVRDLLLQKCKTLYQQGIELGFRMKEQVDQAIELRDTKVPEFTQEQLSQVLPLFQQIDTIVENIGDFTPTLSQLLGSASSVKGIPALESVFQEMEGIISRASSFEQDLKEFVQQITDGIAVIEGNEFDTRKKALMQTLQGTQDEWKELQSFLEEVQVIVQPFQGVDAQDLQEIRKRQTEILETIQSLQTEMNELHTAVNQPPDQITEYSNWSYTIQQLSAKLRSKISLCNAKIRQLQVDVETFREEYYSSRQSYLLPVRFQINKSFSKTRSLSKKQFFQADLIQESVSGEDLSKIFEYRKKLTENLQFLSNLRTETEQRFRKFETNRYIQDISGEESAIQKADSEFIRCEYDAEDAVLQTERWMQQYLLDLIESANEGVQAALEQQDKNRSILQQNQEAIDKLILAAKLTVGRYLIRPLEFIAQSNPVVMNQLEEKRSYAMTLFNQIREPPVTRMQPGDTDFQKEIIPLFQERITTIQTSNLIVKVMGDAFRQAEMVLTRTMNQFDDVTLRYYTILKDRYGQMMYLLYTILNFTKRWDTLFIEENLSSTPFRIQNTELQAEYMVSDAKYKKFISKSSILWNDLIPQEEEIPQTQIDFNKVYLPFTDTIKGTLISISQEKRTKIKTPVTMLISTHISSLQKMKETIESRNSEIRLNFEKRIRDTTTPFDTSGALLKESNEIQNRFKNEMTSINTALDEITQLNKEPLQAISNLFQRLEDLQDQLIDVYAIQIEQESLLLIV